MVTHSPDAAAHGDEVVQLRDGRVGGRLVLPAAPGHDRAAEVLSWLQSLDQEPGPADRPPVAAP
jgi:ABC-type lipoprotein export system ATPase subunit